MFQSESSSSDDNFMPIGIDMLNIKDSNTKRSIMAVASKKKNENEIPELQYYNLLTRALNLLNKSKESTSEKLKLPLSIIRRSRKTYINVNEVAKRIKRTPEHLSHFITSNLYTEGGLNKDGYLVLEGSYLQNDIERVIRDFIELYVICSTCSSPENTYISKENKLFFIKCSHCKGKKCVGSTVEGYKF